MAAAIIPIITTLIPTIAPLVVKLVEKIFGNGTGAVKKPVAVDVMAAIMDALQKLVGPSTSLPVAKPEIAILIQQVVDALNKAGELQGTSTVITPGPASAALDGLAESLIATALKVLQATRRPT